MAIKYYSATEIAKMVREDLKKAYPELTTKKLGGRANYFKVTSNRGGYNASSIRIEWKDYPSPSDIEEITTKYVTEYFDGMTDMWERYEGKTLNGEEFVGICRPSFSFEISPEREAYIDNILEQRGRSKNHRSYYEAKHNLNRQIGYIPEGEPIVLNEPTQEEVLPLIAQVSTEVITEIAKENQQKMTTAINAKGNTATNKQLKDNVATTVFCTLYSRNKTNTLFTSQMYDEFKLKGNIDMQNKKHLYTAIKNNMENNIAKIDTLLYYLQNELHRSEYFSFADMLYAQIIRNNFKEFLQVIVEQMEKKIKDNTQKYQYISIGIEDGKEVFNRLDKVIKKELANTDIFRFYYAKQKELADKLKQNIKANLTNTGEYGKEKHLQKLMINTLFLSAKMSADILNRTNISPEEQKEILDTINKNGVHGTKAMRGINDIIYVISENNPVFKEYHSTTNNGEEIIYNFMKSRFTNQDFEKYSARNIADMTDLNYELDLLADFIIRDLYDNDSEAKSNAEITKLVKQKLNQKTDTNTADIEYTVDEHKLLASKYLKSSFESLAPSVRISMDDIVNIMGYSLDYEKLVNYHYVNKLYMTDFNKEHENESDSVNGEKTHKVNSNYERLDIIKLKTIPFMLSYNKTKKMYQLENLFVRLEYNEKTVQIIYLCSTEGTISKDITTSLLLEDNVLQHSLITYNQFRASINKKLNVKEKEYASKRIHRLMQTFHNYQKNFADDKIQYAVVYDKKGYIYLKPKETHKVKQHYLLTDNKIVVLHVNSEGIMEHFTEIYSTEPSTLTTDIALKTIQKECKQGAVPSKFMVDIGKAIELHKQAIDLRRRLDLK